MCGVRIGIKDVWIQVFWFLFRLKWGCKTYLPLVTFENFAGDWGPGKKVWKCNITIVGICMLEEVFGDVARSGGK